MTQLEKLLSKMENSKSIFEHMRKNASVDILSLFKKGKTVQACDFVESNQVSSFISSENVFPGLYKKQGNKALKGVPLTKLVTGKRIAVLFSGGPAAGGHNVVAGIFDVLGTKNSLFGIKNGPKGLLEESLVKLTETDISNVFNLGGFDLLGSDRTKIKSKEQIECVIQTVKRYCLDAIIIIGGDDSNTNAAFLAEALLPYGCTVVGVPKTIDGDLQYSHYLPISFGFDTATKIYSELVGNILQDTPSSRKYWHFVKLMGRSASHVALEVALQTKPHICLISEEIHSKKTSLKELVTYCCDIIKNRASKGKNYGVVLIPEGLIESIPELHTLINELNQSAVLSHASKSLFDSLPLSQLSVKRDSHGNIEVSQIPTELLLIEMIKANLDESDAEIKFSANHHFFGYEGRCGAPSLFDASYTYNLGLLAGSLALNEQTGYMASISNLNTGGEAVAIPIPALIEQEVRQGKTEFVIKKSLVELNSPAFKYFNSERDKWAGDDYFSSPGPRQYSGDYAKQLPFTVALNQNFSSINFLFD